MVNIANALKNFILVGIIIAVGTNAADHSYQGFGKIKKCVAGKTKMYVNNGNTVSKYVCFYINRNVTRSKSGQIKRTEEMKSAAISNSENIVMYTCNKSDTNITWIVFTPFE